MNNRYEYNQKILELLANNAAFRNVILKQVCGIDPYFWIGRLKKHIEDHPQQRFGQIVCNYIIPDYRNNKPSESTYFLKNYLFEGLGDPFFEESKETYTRIKTFPIQAIKKKLVLYFDQNWEAGAFAYPYQMLHTLQEVESAMERGDLEVHTTNLIYVLIMQWLEDYEIIFVHHGEYENVTGKAIERYPEIMKQYIKPKNINN